MSLRVYDTYSTKTIVHLQNRILMIYWFSFKRLLLELQIKCLDIYTVRVCRERIRREMIGRVTRKTCGFLVQNWCAPAFLKIVCDKSQGRRHATLTTNANDNTDVHYIRLDFVKSTRYIILPWCTYRMHKI